MNKKNFDPEKERKLLKSLWIQQVVVIIGGIVLLRPFVLEKLPISLIEKVFTGILILMLFYIGGNMFTRKRNDVPNAVYWSLLLGGAFVAVGTIMLILINIVGIIPQNQFKVIVIMQSILMMGLATDGLLRVLLLWRVLHLTYGRQLKSKKKIKK